MPTSEPPTSQIPAAPQPPPSPQPRHQPQAAPAGGTTWHRAAETAWGGGFSWPMLALAAVFLALIVVETSQAGVGGAIRVALVVVAVVLVASAVSYLSLARRGEATLRGAVFNWSVVVLAAVAAILFL